MRKALICEPHSLHGEIDSLVVRLYFTPGEAFVTVTPRVGADGIALATVGAATRPYVQRL